MEKNLEKEILITQEGYGEHQQELEMLRGEKRSEIAEKIKLAIEFGDLSENAEYDEAKNEQAQIEARISFLENLLRKAKIVDARDRKKGVVSIGSRVQVKDVATGEIREFTLVGSSEANSRKGKVSNESPVGEAVLGKKPGKTVTVKAPVGKLKFEILKILDDEK